MITGIHDHDAIDLEAIAKCQSRVVQIPRLDIDLAEPERALDEIMIAGRGAKVLQTDRKVGLLHLPGESIAQGVAEAVGPVDVPFIAGHEQRREEWQALDVVPVGVTDQEVTAYGAGAHGLQRKAEILCAAAAIKDDPRAILRLELDAGGVASVAKSIGPRLGDRAPCPPETHSHGGAAVRGEVDQDSATTNLLPQP